MEFSVAEIGKQIYQVRGAHVMLDSDLAQYYQTETRTLNQAVRRNIKKFPEDFMFQLSKGEFEILKPQIARSATETRGGRQKLPLVFTEQGVGMLSCLLNNDRAIQVSVAAFRAFTRIRQTSGAQTEVIKKLDHLEHKFDEFRRCYDQFEDKFESHFKLNANPARQILTERQASEVRPSPIFINSLEVRRVEKIQHTVSNYYGLKVEDLKSTTRIRSVSLPRQIAMYLIRKYTGLGLKEIGLYFGGKDHTTILHACSKIDAGLEGDQQIRDAVEAIQNLL